MCFSQLRRKALGILAAAQLQKLPPYPSFLAPPSPSSPNWVFSTPTTVGLPVISQNPYLFLLHISSPQYTYLDHSYSFELQTPFLLLSKTWKQYGLVAVWVLLPPPSKTTVLLPCWVRCYSSPIQWPANYKSSLSLPRQIQWISIQYGRIAFPLSLSPQNNYRVYTIGISL